MSYSTQQDILDFVEDNNVKFVRFAFCDIFGTQKNIAVLAATCPRHWKRACALTAAPLQALCTLRKATLYCGRIFPP